MWIDAKEVAVWPVFSVNLVHACYVQPHKQNGTIECVAGQSVWYNDILAKQAIMGLDWVGVKGLGDCGHVAWQDEGFYLFLYLNALVD